MVLSASWVYLHRGLPGAPGIFCSPENLSFTEITSSKNEMCQNWYWTQVPELSTLIFLFVLRTLGKQVPWSPPSCLCSVLLKEAQGSGPSAPLEEEADSPRIPLPLSFSIPRLWAFKSSLGDLPASPSQVLRLKACITPAHEEFFIH